MKIIVNLTNLVKGGALQASVAFAAEVAKDSQQHEWYFLVSSIIKNEFDYAGVNLQNVISFESSPAKNKELRKKIVKTTLNINPNVVLTLFGPAYIKFPFLHIMGVGDGWVTHSSLIAFMSLQKFPYDWIKVLGIIFYKGYWFKKADFWIVEAECALKGLNRRLLIQRNKIKIIPNTCNKRYIEAKNIVNFPQVGGIINVLVFAGPYKHKKLDIIPIVAEELKKSINNYQIRFILTLPQNCSIYQEILLTARLNGTLDMIVNEGVIPVANGLQLYQKCQISFLPTILETFSAVYPESMAMGLPIVTSDLQFARVICADAALYFKPGNALAAAEMLKKLINNREIMNDLVLKGKEQLKKFPTQEEKYKMYMDTLSSVVGRT